MQLRRRDSKLQLVDGKLSVRIIQAKSGLAILGDRQTFAKPQRDSAASAGEPEAFKARLDTTEPGELAILSYHPGVSAQHDALTRLSEDRTIVTLGGLDAATHENRTLIASEGELISQAKLSLSSDDLKKKTMVGDDLYLFGTEQEDGVRWAVLNCHDYSHPDLLVTLLAESIDLLVVVTDNNATRLYWEYATSDVHRLFCYIVIVNIAELGGSGVFVPFRRVGREANAKFGASGQIFGTRGPAETSAVVDLDIKALRAQRDRFRTLGLDAIRKGEGVDIEYMVPPQNYMATPGQPAGRPTAVIDKIDMEWNSVKPTVAVGQLKSMPIPAYYASDYRLRRDPDVEAFQAKLEGRLALLRQEIEADENGLDFLVLPEVLVPRDFAEEKLTKFAREMQAVVIAGVDYPGETENDNANECMIIDRSGKVHSYRKVTRSQYDAIGRDKKPMAMQRGDRLYRFHNRDGHAFGVLICYDFSHIGLVTALNLDHDRDPLDILFIVAHNPFGMLYRSSCIADSHRFYQHVVMCNVADYGGSGIFLPERTKGPRQVLLEIGVNTEAIATATLNLEKVREARGTDDHNLHIDEMMRKPGIFQGRRIPERHKAQAQ